MASSKQKIYRQSGQRTFGNPLIEESSFFSCLAFSPNEEWLVSGHNEGTCRLWQVASRKSIGKAVKGHHDKVISIAFSPNNQFFASGSNDTLCQLWQVAAGPKLLCSFRGHTNQINCLVFSHHGHLLASAGFAKVVHLWSIEQQTAVACLTGHENSLENIAFSPDDALLMSTSYDRTCRLWSTQAFVCLKLWHWPLPIRQIAFVPEENPLYYQIIWYGGGSIITLWQIAKATLEHKLVEFFVDKNTPLLAQNVRVNDCEALSDENKRLLIEKYGACDPNSTSNIDLLDYEIVSHDLQVTVEQNRPTVSACRKTWVSFVSESLYLANTQATEADHANPQETAEALWQLADLAADAALSNAITLLKEAPIQTKPKVLDCLHTLWQTDINRAQALRALFLNIVKRSKSPIDRTPSPEICQSSANAATILNAMAEHLNDLDWQNVQLPGADLSYGRLWHTNLTNANLQGACLAHAVLIGANLSGANLTDVFFDEYPMIKTPLTINALALHPEKPWVALAQGHVVTLYDQTTTQIIAPYLRGHTDIVTSVAFSHDGTYIASGSKDESCVLWMMSNDHYTVVHRFTGHTDAITSITFSIYGFLISGSKDWTCRLWEIGNLSPPALPASHALVGHTGPVLSIAISQNGKYLASGSSDWTCRLWDVASQEQIQILTGHTNEVVSVAFSPNSMLLATGSTDKTCRLWHGLLPAQIFENYSTPIQHDTEIKHITFSPQGLLAFASFAYCQLWSVAEQTPQLVLVKVLFQFCGTYGISFNKTGTYLACASGYGYNIDNPPSCQFYRIPDHTRVGRFWQDFQSVKNLAFSPDGKWLGSGHEHNTCGLWQMDQHLDQAHQLWTVHPPKRARVSEKGPLKLIFHPSKPLVLSCSTQTGYQLWNISDQTPIGTWIENYMDIAAFNSTGTLLVSPGRNFGFAAANAACQLWQISEQNIVASGAPLSGQAYTIHCVAFSPTENIFASGSSDQTCLLRDATLHLPLGQPLIGHFAPVVAIEFSPDGKTLASASSDKTCILWDVASQKQKARLTGHTKDVTSIAFSPDGKFLASGSRYDQTCRIWHVLNQECIRILKWTEEITSIAFAPHIHYRLAIGGKCSISLWLLIGETLEAKLEDLIVTAHTSLILQSTIMHDCIGLSESNAKLLTQYNLDSKKSFAEKLAANEPPQPVMLQELDVVFEADVATYTPRALF